MSDKAINILKKVFPELNHDSIQAVYDTATVKTYNNGAVLCHEGATEDVFYVILEGTVNVYKNFDGNHVYLASKREGDFFGEMALVLDQPRTADVVTDGTVQVMELLRDDFHAHMMSNTEVMIALQRMTVELLKRHTNKLNEMLVQQSMASKPDSSKTGRVFISYSRVDTPFVIKVLNQLDEHDIPYWFDQTDIPPGADWDDTVGKALEEATAMLLFISPESMASRTVKNEWRHFFMKLNRPLVPIIVKPVDSLHRDLAFTQHIVLHDEAQFEQNMKEVIAALESALGIG